MVIHSLRQVSPRPTFFIRYRYSGEVCERDPGAAALELDDEAPALGMATRQVIAIIGGGKP